MDEALILRWPLRKLQGWTEYYNLKAQKMSIPSKEARSGMGRHTSIFS